jgi:hypothetical protein
VLVGFNYLDMNTAVRGVLVRFTAIVGEMGMRSQGVDYRMVTHQVDADNVARIDFPGKGYP